MLEFQNGFVLIMRVIRDKRATGQWLRGHKNARAAARTASACRDELALFVPASVRPERGSDSVAPGRRTSLIRFIALPPVPFPPLPCRSSCFWYFCFGVGPGIFGGRSNRKSQTYTVNHAHKTPSGVGLTQFIGPTPISYDTYPTWPLMGRNSIRLLPQSNKL